MKDPTPRLIAAARPLTATRTMLNVWAVTVVATLATRVIAQTQGEEIMTDDSSTPQSSYAERPPSPDLKALEKLVGTWKVSGPDISGRTVYEWMEGGYFLIQRFDFIHGGREVQGMEVIGHLQPFGEAPSAEIRSRVYDTVGNTLDYVYELEGDTLTIWGGERGSPAYYKGTFSKDGNTLSGAWVYPGGGGYEATMTRIE